MNEATVEIESQTGHERCLVQLKAREIPDRAFELEITPTPAIVSTSENEFESNSIRILCGSGLAYARSQLQLAGGLDVKIVRIEGEVSRQNERGVSLAVAIAVAVATGKDHSELIDSQAEWTLSPL